MSGYTAQITVLWSTACQDTHCPNYSSLEHSVSGYTLPKLQFSGAQHVRIHTAQITVLWSTACQDTLPKLQFSGAQRVRIHCPNYSSLEHSVSGYTAQITVLWSTACQDTHCPNYSSLEHSVSGYTAQITVLWSTACQDTLPKLQFSGALDSELHCHVQPVFFFLNQRDL